MKQFYLLLTLIIGIVCTASGQQAVAQQNLTIAAGDTTILFVYLTLPKGATIVKSQLAIGQNEVLTKEVSDVIMFRSSITMNGAFVAANNGKNKLGEVKDARYKPVLDITDLIATKGYFTVPLGGGEPIGDMQAALYKIALPRQLDKVIGKWWLVTDYTVPNEASPKQHLVSFRIWH